ncbi:hypothetical protein XNC3_2410020 [Xenorhabdus nematophila F1]|nr:hypothetical protein XNC3_2410020 [Xenorhabdus nematophila F1]
MSVFNRVSKLTIEYITQINLLGVLLEYTTKADNS